MNKTFFLLLVLVLIFVYFNCDKKESFSNNPKLMYFYSPRCSYCKAFNATWNELENHYDSFPVDTVKIDCTSDDKTCSSYDIKGYPTLLFKKENNAYEFRGDRDKKNIMKFVDKLL